MIFHATKRIGSVSIMAVTARGVFLANTRSRCLRWFARNLSSDDTDKYIITGPISRVFMAYVKNMGFSQMVNDTETQSTIHTPGLSLEAIDMDGNPCMPRLMTFVTSSRIFANHVSLDKSGRTIFDFAQVTSDRMIFVGSSAFQTDKAMYDISVPKCPLDVTYQLGFIGKSSFSTVTSIVVPSTGQVIASNINQVIGIDRKSRRPIPLPDWWREKFAEVGVLKKPLVIPKLDLAVNHYPFEVKVTWSHTDMNKHANYTSYVEFCIDALHAAVEAGTLSSMTKDIIRHGIKSTRHTYFGESLQNDELIVNVWESDSVKNTVHFDIQKCGNTIFQSTFVYHE